MLHAAIVPVHGHPVVQGLLAGQGIFVLRIRVAQEVPGGACPLGHGVRLPLGRATATGTGGVHPVLHGRQRGFAVVRWLVGLHLGQHQGQFAFVQRHEAAFLAFHDGNGLAPVALSGEHPVTELEVGLALAQALLLQPLCNLFLGIRHGQAVQEIGIHQDSTLHIRIHRLLDADGASCHHLDDGQVELLGEVPVPLVMGGHSHDGACTIGHQYIVGNPDRYLLAVHGIGGGEAVDLHAGLVLGQLRALEVGLLGRLLPVGHQIVVIPNLIFILFNQRMLRGHHHIGSAEEGVRPGGVDAQLLLLSGEGEVHLRALRLAYPVLLGHFDPLDVVHRVQTLDELVGVLRNLQHPLALHLAYHLRAAALADAVHHLFVGQSHLTGGAPVDGHLALVGQSCLEEL